ncbi:MAG: ABC transporter ATP-binding protein [Lachnospira sp.]|nr:ABC transporter ATP-binding protein [Lachnospira sp.]
MIKAENVSKHFEDFVALDSVTCNIQDGCIYGMVGSNGAGKSTFLRVLAGVYKADQGQAYIDGEPSYENPKAKNKMVFVADELFFLPGASMNSMASFYRSIYDRFDDERFKYLTGVFGLNPRKNIANFSKGMKRQVAIILALSTRAKYMFFDETFDGLDPVMRNLVKKLICNDVAELNSTVIVTSHSLSELEDICDHLALLHKGGMVLDSDVLDLKTAQFKVQVAFMEPFSQELFEGMKITRYRQEGSVANMIISGDREECISKFKALNPAVLDVLPLTLEEVFTYEMEALGYNFENVLEGMHNEQ